MKIHCLKIESPYLDDIKSGKKKFEWRKNDRDFETGDLLVLQEILNDTFYPDPDSGSGMRYEYDKSGERVARIVVMRVTYITAGMFEITPGYCILGIEPVSAQIEKPLKLILRGDEEDIAG
jgi:hypothetical protein